MQMFDRHSVLSLHGSPKPFFMGPSVAASTDPGASPCPPPEPLEPLDPPPPLPPDAAGSGPAQPSATRITTTYLIRSTFLKPGGAILTEESYRRQAWLRIG